MTDRSAPVSAPALAAAVGMPYSTFDKWIRAGLVRPTGPAAGTGSRRWFTARDQANVALLRELDAAVGGEGTKRRRLPVVAAALQSWAEIPPFVVLIGRDRLHPAATAAEAAELIATGRQLSTVIRVSRVLAHYGIEL